jgi:hypothetical protein
MSKIVTIESCENGTITRACARAINRALREAGFEARATLSGSSRIYTACVSLRGTGLEYREVWAAELAGADKGRHTKEVNRSRAAQARRLERAQDEAIALVA